MSYVIYVNLGALKNTIELVIFRIQPICHSNCIQSRDSFICKDTIFINIRIERKLLVESEGKTRQKWNKARFI